MIVIERRTLINSSKKERIILSINFFICYYYNVFCQVIFGEYTKKMVVREKVGDSEVGSF